jgi:hypothetical protein
MSVRNAGAAKPTVKAATPFRTKSRLVMDMMVNPVGSGFQVP